MNPKQYLKLLEELRIRGISNDSQLEIIIELMKLEEETQPKFEI